MSNRTRLSLQDVQAIDRALSAPRLARYVSASGVRNKQHGIALYAWNAAVSGAFLNPLHLCEVTIRNGAAEVLEAVYGPAWPWSAGFLRSLPGHGGISPQQELQRAIRGQSVTGKVVAELKFAFWNDLFTRRHDARLWNPWLRRAFPHMPGSMTPEQCRLLIFQQLSKVRKLRNRIAHHEPIFERHLEAEYQRVLSLVGWRCPRAARWVDDTQLLTGILTLRP